VANPQKENGFTAIANEIMDALIKYRIPGEKRQVLDFILRNIYGWKDRKRVELSYQEIAVNTGLKKQNVYRAVKWLSSKLITKVIKSDYSKKQVYEFNKNYEEWEPFIKKKMVIKSDYDKVIKSDYDSKILPIIVKTRKQCKKYSDAFLFFWNLYPVKKSKGKAFEIWNRLKKKNQLPDLDILKTAIKNQTEEKKYLLENNKFCPEWKHPTTWLNQSCWEDETSKPEEDDPFKECSN